jgi:hypothetical protein
MYMPIEGEPDTTEEPPQLLSILHLLLEEINGLRDILMMLIHDMEREQVE